MSAKIRPRGYRFFCNDCENGFDEYDEVEEDRGEFWGMPAYETMYYCPFCGSEDFDEVEEEDEEDED